MNEFKPTKDNWAQLRVGFICIIIFLALASCALGCMSVISSCEKDARYFSPSTTVYAFIAVLILTVLVSFVSLFLFKKERIDIYTGSVGYARFARYSSILPALSLLLLAAFALFEEELGEWGNTILALGAISILYFAFKTSSRLIIPKVISGFAVFALCAIIIASLYLELKIEINSHFKLLVQFGAAGTILGTIADLRAILSPKTPDGFKLPEREFLKIGVRGFIFLKSLALISCAVCAAVIILYFADGHTALTKSYIVYSLFYLTYSISVIAELIGVAISIGKSHI